MSQRSAPSISSSTGRQIAALQDEARLIQSDAAGAGEDVGGDAFMAAGEGDHKEDDKDDDADQAASATAHQDHHPLNSYIRGGERPARDVQRDIEQGIMDSLTDPYLPSNAGDQSVHRYPPSLNLPKVYSVKGKAKKARSSSHSADSDEEVRRIVAKDLEEGRPITPEPTKIEDLFSLFEQLTPTSRKTALGRLLPVAKGPNHAESDSETPQAQDNPYRRPVAKAPPPTSTPSSSKHKLSPQGLPSLKKIRHQAPLLGRSDSEPSLIRGRPFQPKAKSTATVDLPSLVVINKLRNSMYVPLWHFTQEGIVEGRARDAHVVHTTTPTIAQLLDSSGPNAQLGQHKKQDPAMSYAEMSSAFKAFDKSMEKVVAEAKGEVKEWLQIEKDAWVDMWSSVRDHPLIGKSGGWAILARYVDLLRHDYYDAPYGYRLDPATWQSDIMARVKMFLDFNSIIEASSSSSGAHQAGHGGNQQASSSSGKSAQKKNKAQGGKQPFSSGASTSPDGLGACFVCGSRVRHNINDCNRVPEGRETAHAKRDASRKLIRAS
ncbi:hypothetical protein CF336_g9023, partial [Tilletia laevis]